MKIDMYMRWIREEEKRIDTSMIIDPLEIPTSDELNQIIMGVRV